MAKTCMTKTIVTILINMLKKGLSKVAPLYTHRTAIDKGLSDTCVSVQFIESAIKSVKRNSAPRMIRSPTNKSCMVDP